MSQSTLLMQVVEITPETADAITIHLEHPDKIAIPYQAGQFLTLIMPVNGKKERRAYSLCSSPAEQPRLSVTVKRVAGGRLSNYLLDQLRVGDAMEVLAPLGNFNLIPATVSRTVVLIAAGSGITPLMSMIKTVLQEEATSRVLLIYGNRNENTVIFKNQLQKLQQQYPERLSITHIYSQPLAAKTLAKSSGSLLGRLFSKSKDTTTVSPPEESPAVYSGRLNRTMLIKILENQPEIEIAAAHYYLCGPEGLMDEAKAALQILHVPLEQILKESFVSSGHNAADTGGEASNEENNASEITDQVVTILYEGGEYAVEVAKSETILEAALNQNIDLPFSCQAGLCTACRGKCLSGKVHLEEREGLSDAEINEGYVLTCVGHPLTQDVIIQIG